MRLGVRERREDGRERSKEWRMLGELGRCANGAEGGFDGRGNEVERSAGGVSSPVSGWKREPGAMESRMA